MKLVKLSKYLVPDILAPGHRLQEKFVTMYPRQENQCPRQGNQVAPRKDLARYHVPMKRCQAPANRRNPMSNQRDLGNPMKGQPLENRADRRINRRDLMTSRREEIRRLTPSRRTMFSPKNYPTTYCPRSL